MSIRIRWCDDAAAVASLVRFFVEQVDTDYISHGEIVDGRALDAERWSPRLAEVLAAEFGACRFDGDLTADGKFLALAERDGVLLAIALFERVGSHAWLHDLVVARDARGKGVGEAVLAWLEAQAASAGVRDMLLESGAGNDGAHRFFSREGYTTVSVVMRKALRQTR